MNATRRITRLIATLAIVIAALAILPTVLSSWPTKRVVTTAMAGHWEENGRIIVSWCHQTSLPVKVEIQADGSVTGTVGDAKLTEGRFQRNRGCYDAV
jgi:hypothetical protein